ncbi:MAG: YaiI/YqxD family protein [Rhodocyclaceae bacterium]|nr:YaiI/YqxD family protein [Rhodocyclaceae bacterium]
MQIWIDADACPAAIKDILFRAAQRRRIDTTLVANHLARIPASPHLRAVQVPAGFDVADNYIVAQVAARDLVITADIPLAAAVIERGAVALNPRGALYTAENIQDCLATRNLMEELRATGQVSGGPAAMSKADVQAFANRLDAYLTRHA